MDAIVLLKAFLDEEENVLDFVKSNYKMQNIQLMLVRRFLITTDNVVTIEGKNLLSFLEDAPEKAKLVKPKIEMKSFEDWWEIFPRTDAFTYKGTVFGGTRTLRVNKEKCKGYFEKILKKGVYTGEQIIAATLYDINLKKENSFKKRSNQLTFMQNSGTYLYNDIYEGFIPLAKDGSVVSEGASRGLEIDI